MRGCLLDENLPAGLPFPHGLAVHHVTAFEHRMSDAEVWKTGRDRDLVIVTKDADFFHRCQAHGSPPKVIWFRTGNMRREEFEAFFAARWSQISGLIENADLVEVHRHRIEALRFETR